MQIRGRIVHKRSLSKKLCFFDVIDCENIRRNCALKLWICGDKQMDRALKSNDYRIHVGDFVNFHVKINEDHLESFDILSFDVEEKFSQKNPHQTFLPIPPPAANQQQSTIGKPCKFWLNTGKCPRENCKFTHIYDSNQLQNLRDKYVKEKLHFRELLQHETEEPNNLLSRHKRSEIFSQWLMDKFSSIFIEKSNEKLFVLDVAGGRGDLAFELKFKCKIIPEVLIIDPRGQKVKKWQQKLLKKCESTNCELPKHIDSLFDDDIFEKIPKQSVAMIIGMHPDEATEPIIDIALKHKISFAVIPCCVFSHLFPNRRIPSNGIEPKTYEQYLQYLCEKNSNILVDNLKFRGRDKVLYWSPFNEFA